MTYLGEYIMEWKLYNILVFDWIRQDLDAELYHDLIVDYRMGEDQNGLISWCYKLHRRSASYIDVASCQHRSINLPTVGRSSFVRLKYNL